MFITFILLVFAGKQAWDFSGETVFESPPAAHATGGGTWELHHRRRVVRVNCRACLVSRLEILVLTGLINEHAWQVILFWWVFEGMQTDNGIEV